MIDWRAWFEKANKIAWQGVDVPDNYVSGFINKNKPNCTEAMYQAFKARLLEETQAHTTKEQAHEG